MNTFMDLYNYSKKNLEIFEIENVADKLNDINNTSEQVKIIRIRIISNVNYAFLKKILIGIGVRFGLNLSIDIAPYNQVVQESIIDSNNVNEEKNI